MSKDKSEVVVLENDINRDSEIVNSDITPVQPVEESVSPQFLKLAKRFAIDGALLPQ